MNDVRERLYGAAVAGTRLLSSIATEDEDREFFAALGAEISLMMDGGLLRGATRQLVEQDARAQSR